MEPEEPRSEGEGSDTKDESKGGRHKRCEVETIEVNNWGARKDATEETNLVIAWKHPVGQNFWIYFTFYEYKT